MMYEGKINFADGWLTFCSVVPGLRYFDDKIGITKLGNFETYLVHVKAKTVLL